MIHILFQGGTTLGSILVGWEVMKKKPPGNGHFLCGLDWVQSGAAGLGVGTETSCWEPFGRSL